MEAWAVYGFWLDREIESTLNRFLPGALDEYQLEARMKDFVHEIYSPLNNALREEIKYLILKKRGGGGSCSR